MPSEATGPVNWKKKGEKEKRKNIFWEATGPVNRTHTVVSSKLSALVLLPYKSHCIERTFFF
jgi:hypothetical protein